MRTINELCYVISGGTPKTTISSYWNGNIPWISIKDFINSNRYVTTTEKAITLDGLQHSAANMLQTDDIIISARGTVGKVAICSRQMAFNQSCFGLRTKNQNTIDQHYLFYWLLANRNRVQTGSHGAVFDTITRSDFDRIKIDIPPIEVQRHIVGITSSLQ